MFKSDLKNHLTEYSELVKERGLVYSDWLKSILTIATALFAVLVALKTERSANESIHCAYLTVVISTAIGIFLGVIVLYADVRILSRTIKEKNHQIQKLLNGDQDVEPFKPIFHPKYHTVLKYGCYLSFMCSLVALCIYAILIDQ